MGRDILRTIASRVDGQGSLFVQDQPQEEEWNDEDQDRFHARLSGSSGYLYIYISIWIVLEKLCLGGFKSRDSEVSLLCSIPEMAN